jgi:hypothetical protein
VLPSQSGAPIPVDVLCKEGYHREFTYLLGGYLPIDSPPLFYGGALRLDRVLQAVNLLDECSSRSLGIRRTYYWSGVAGDSRVPLAQRWRRH